MNRPPCPDYEPLLARAADDALSPAELARLDAHLATCEHCRAALADQKMIRAVLLDRPTLSARPDFAARVGRAIEADRSWLDRLDFRIWTWRLVPVAAALSLVAFLVLRQPMTSTASTTTTGTGATSGDTSGSGLPVATALWDESVSDTSLLSLMLQASANDTLPASKER